MQRGRIKKQWLAGVILGGMLCMLLPAGVWAAQTVSYIDESGVEQTAEAEAITSGTTTLNEGWYVVDADLDVMESITVNGHARLILKDSATLTVTGISRAGVTVEDDNTLTIYGQSGGTGKLEATGRELRAGIGGGYNKNGGTVNIYGGRVKAIGGLGGAGIGGGVNKNGGTVNIYGGRVEAVGGNGGASIGGGGYGNGGTINIYGGRVEAVGGNGGAGIGGGGYGNGGTINIYGGTVNAQGKDDGAGIGGGLDGNGGTINISGGTVTATSINAEAVGRGVNGTDKTVTIVPPADVPLYVYAGDAAPGALLAGSPFTASTPYTGTERYFYLSKDPLPSGGQSPSAIPGTLTDSDTGIGVSGAFRSGTTMTMGDILMHEPGQCPACDAIRAAQQDSDLTPVLWMDISLSRDCDGPFTVTIPVGAAYEGQTLTILHCAGGELEEYTAVVREGKVTFTVESLSPLAVYAGGALDDIPITGDTDSTLIWWVLCGVSAAGIILIIIVSRKLRAEKR